MVLYNFGSYFGSLRRKEVRATFQVCDPYVQGNLFPAHGSQGFLGMGPDFNRFGKYVLQLVTQGYNHILLLWRMKKFIPLVLFLISKELSGETTVLLFHIYLKFNAYLWKKQVICENVAMKEEAIQMETGFFLDGKQIPPDFTTRLWKYGDKDSVGL